MLLKVEDGAFEPKTMKNMHVTSFNQMSLFKLALDQPEESEEQSVTVTYSGPNDSLPLKSISIPLLPDTSTLENINVVMHSSPTKAFDMGAKYGAWFSEQFGFKVVLAYIGPMRRPILGSFNPAARESSLTSAARSISSLVSSYLPAAIAGDRASPASGITFADCAMFLVVTEESLAAASARLPQGVEMDVRKFRPNIVVDGAEGPWVEDLWSEIRIKNGEGADVDIPLTHNCVRCTSINVDYSTGKPALGEDGKMLKKLMSDRRVDEGAKYSPVFGRYGYLRNGAGMFISVGDGISVTEKLEKTTTFGRPDPSVSYMTYGTLTDSDWPGMTN